MSKHINNKIVRNNRYKTNKKWKKDCTVQPMNTMRVA